MIYEYECKNNHTWEEERKIDERNNLSTCPNCGSDGHQVLLGASSFILKGGGWASSGYSSYVGDTMPKHLQGRRYE